MDRVGCVGTGDGTARQRTERGREARLVARRDRRLDDRREKGGDLTGRSPVNRGRPSTKYHLAVEGQGWPLARRLGPGNENERAHALPLLDELLAHGYLPAELWADRGYCSDPLRHEISERGVKPRISRRRRPGEPDLPDQKRRTATRGRKRVIRRSDPDARHRWVVERTNAWLRRFRRLNTRYEPNAHVYLAYLTIALIIILARAL